MPVRVRQSWPVWLLGLALLGGLTEASLLGLWQRNGYWGFSDGVYALSAREWLHGAVPYRDFAAAQPPPVFLFGVLLLAVHDGIVSLHVGLGLLDLVTAGLVGYAVWRLDGGRGPALGAAAAAPLLPISLNQHAQLIPETLAAPLLLAGALLCARPGRPWLGAVLLALAAWCKVAFLIPGLAITLASRGRLRATATLVLAALALSLASLAVFGSAEWRQTVTAQLQVGRAPLHYAAGLLAQAAWNELPLVLGAVAFAVLAWRGRAELREPELPRALLAGGAGGLVLALTVFKRGSYVDVMAAGEPILLVLAACGAASCWRRVNGRARARVAVVLLAALLAGQSASLLVSPGDPGLAVRPLASSGLAWTASPSGVGGLVAAARRCSGRLAYSGTPWIAFLAGRRMPGDQPDPFMLEHASADAGFARRAAGDRPLCP